MRGPRLAVPALAALLGLLPAAATARIAPPIHVRWLGEVPAPTRSAREFAGQFELQTAASGIVDDLRLEGKGWSVRSLDAAPRMTLAKGDRRTVAFRATPSDPAEPLVVRGTFDGRPFQETFRFDEASLSGARARGLVFRQAPPRLLGKKTPAVAGGQTIRFTGRFMYMRDDGMLVGGDNIIVRIMDDDPIIDEEIWSGPTDIQGNFDVTVNWDDCDILGCDDPDIYVVYEVANGVVDVRADDLLQNTYTWSSEDQVIGDFTGSQVDFGVDQPGNNVGAAHIYTNIIRAFRAVSTEGGMVPPLVECAWPDADATEYDQVGEVIHITNSETWTEGTHIHEFGHHLEATFGTLSPPQYQNGYCDFNGNPGHCTWCPENLVDAWQEGWANWLGSYVTRGYPALYGITSRSTMDTRYVLETARTCQQDTTTFFPDATTEGYVGALLRDIEDTENEDSDGGAPDCSTDVMTLGADEILTIIRDDDPVDALAFMTRFRQRYPQHDQDLWSTTLNVASVFTPSLPNPVITTQPAFGCRMLKAGEFLTLSVDANGAKLRYRWRKDGVALSNAGGYAGATTKQLMMGPVTASFAGTYDCEVRVCDSTLATLSSAVSISIFSPVASRNLITWGENQGAECGGGPPPTAMKPPGNHTGLFGVVQADGGRQYFLGLKADGTVVSWGSQGSGALGRPGVYTYALPGAIAGLSNIVQIAAGYYHGIALDKDGVVRGWGYNLYGQVGDGTGTDRSTPVLSTAFPSCVKAIAAGEEFTAVLASDGTVWTVGRNSSGQLGRTTPLGYSRTPAPVPGLTGVISIAANIRRMYAIKSDGTVWGWGEGVLGNGTATGSGVPVQVTGITDARSVATGYSNSYVIRNDGQVWGWGSANILGNGGSGTIVTTPVEIPQLANAVKIEVADGTLALALMGDGTLRVWGINGAHNVFNNAAVLSSNVPIVVPGINNVSGFAIGYNTAVTIGGDGTVDVELPAPEIASLELSVSPNPSRAMTQVRFTLPQAGPVSLGVYDVAGRLVRTLASEFRAEGPHVIDWNERAPHPGVYFVRLRASGQSLTRTIMRVR